MPYVVFVKAPNLDYLRYIQHNDKQRMSKMRTVEFFFRKNYFLILGISRKVIWEIVHC
jgi:hypothetical protein